MYRPARTVLFTLLTLVAIFSQTQVHAQGKTAVLNIQQAILLTEEAQSRLKDLRGQTSYKENKARLDELRKEHDDIIKKLQKDMAVMGEEEKLEQRRSIEEKRADIEHVMRKLQAAEQQLGQALVQELAPKLQQIVTDLLKTEGIGLLLNSEAVLHADNSYDITAKVTDRLNRAR